MAKEEAGNHITSGEYDRNINWWWKRRCLSLKTWLMRGQKVQRRIVLKRVEWMLKYQIFGTGE